MIVKLRFDLRVDFRIVVWRSQLFAKACFDCGLACFRVLFKQGISRHLLLAAKVGIVLGRNSLLPSQVPVKCAEGQGAVRGVVLLDRNDRLELKIVLVQAREALSQSAGTGKEVNDGDAALLGCRIVATFCQTTWYLVLTSLSSWMRTCLVETGGLAASWISATAHSVQPPRTIFRAC